MKEIGDSILLYKGGEFGERSKKPVVAISQCILTLDNIDQVKPCEDVLSQFSEILSRRDDSEIQYEWANVKRSGLIVRFDILWYDEEFFMNRREAYKVGPHPLILARIGIKPDNLTVKHVRCAPVSR